MRDAHQRYEQLAVDHVLGGLSRDDAAAFRAHLVSCRDCRRRVAELRDIAAGLEATEREERLRATVGDGSASSSRLADRSWPLRAAALVALIGLVALGFWSYHLWRVASEYESTVTAQRTVLDVISTGEPLEVEGREGVRTLAARDGGTVAVSISALPRLPADRILLLWLLDGEEVIEQRLLAYGRITEETRTLPFAVTVGRADRLVVSVERRGSAQPATPGERTLVTVRVARDGGG